MHLALAMFTTRLMLYCKSHWFERVWVRQEIGRGRRASLMREILKSQEENVCQCRALLLCREHITTVNRRRLQRALKDLLRGWSDLLTTIWALPCTTPAIANAMTLRTGSTASLAFWESLTDAAEISSPTTI